MFGLTEQQISQFGLTWGLVLLNQSDGVAWLGTHIIMIAMALMLAKHDRLMILKKW